MLEMLVVLVIIGLIAGLPLVRLVSPTPVLWLVTAVWGVCAAGALVARLGDNPMRVASLTTIAILLIITGIAVDLRWRHHLATVATPK